MPIHSGYVSPFYRRENGIDCIYAQSVIPNQMVPFFLHRHQAFPSVLIHTDDSFDVIGRVEPTRIFYDDVDPTLSSCKFESKPRAVIVGYTLPYLHKPISVPFMVNAKIFCVYLRFVVNKDRVRIIVLNSFGRYSHYLHRFNLNDHLRSHLKKYYSGRGFRQLFLFNEYRGWMDYNIPCIVRESDKN